MKEAEAQGKGAVSLDGRLIEEMTINEYKVNQPINPKRFEGKPEVKY